MKTRFEKYSQNNILLSILLLLLGLLLFIWPGKTLEIVATILGIGLLVAALVSGISWYRGKDKAGSSYATLALALVLLAAGVIVLVAPEGVVKLLPTLIGIVMIINGILNLAQAMDLRKLNPNSWLPALVMALLTIAAGLFLVIFSFQVVTTAVMVIGAIFIYDGASNLFIETRYRKAGKGK